MTDTKLIQSEQVRFNDSPSDPLITLNQIQSLPDQAKVVLRVHEQQEKMSVHSLVVNYRPYDCAVAVADVCKKMFGVTLQNGSGFRPAETKRVPISLTETREVPWGPNSIPALEDAQMEVGATHDDEKGLLGQVQVYVKNKFVPQVKEFFNEIERHLAQHSIYRGSIIVGTDYPEFYDISWFRPELVTHSDLVSNALEVFLMTRIRNLPLLPALGERFGAKILTRGPFGSGKTSTFLQAASLAVQHGIGAVVHRAGVDDVFDTLRTAKLLAPCLVLLEDIDVIAHRNLSDREVQRLLEAFDGTTSKGDGVIIFMTTNHHNEVAEGMLRPGRIDLQLEINELDRNGVEKLIRGHVGHLLSEDVDFDAVYAVTTNTDGSPAFTGSHVESMIRHVRMAGLYRTGQVEFQLTTADFVRASAPVWAQKALQAEALGSDEAPAIEQAIGSVVDTSLKRLIQSDQFFSRLHRAATMANSQQMGSIEEVVDESNERAINNTAVMDRYAEEKRGQLMVE